MSVVDRSLRRLVASWLGASLVALLAFAASSVGAPATQGASPTSSFYFDGEVRDGFVRGNAGIATTPDATFSSSPIGGMAQVFINDPSGPDWWITAGGPGGAKLVPGTYDDVAWDSDPTKARLFLDWDFVAGAPCSDHDADFTVHDVAYDGDSFARLSMTMSVTCRDASAGGVFHGELRFNSTSPTFKAVSQDPFGRTLPFADTLVSETSAKRIWTLTNVGTGSLTFGTASLGGANPGQFGILDDTCSDTTLAEGASCAFATRFEPTKGGDHRAIASLPVDTPLGHRQVELRGTGIQPTTTTIIVPTGWVWGPVRFEAHVTPNPERGSQQPFVGFVWQDDPGLIAFPALDTDGDAATTQTLAPGDHRVYAEFHSYRYYAPSRSDTVVVHVGETTSIELTSDANPIASSQQPLITARLSSTSTPVDGGELVLKDLTTDTILGTFSPTPGQQSLQVQPALSVGEHDIKATYSGHERYGSSSKELTQTVLMDATATVSPSTFYPVVDDYYDTLMVEGTRAVPVAVDIDIRSASTHALVHAGSVPSATGDFSWTWDGKVAGGSLAPAGAYDVTVTLDDGGPNPKNVERQITLSHDYVTWKNKSVTLAGRRFSLVGKTKNATISTTKSSYSGGVRLASNKGFAAVVYVFPVQKAGIYGTMRFDVRGKSTNRHKAVIALWNRTLGGYRDLDNYDAAKVIGSRYKWWKTSTPGQVHVKKGKARAAVMVWKGLGRKGGSTFDIRKVRLVYKVGTLHSGAAASVADSSLETELRTAARAATTGAPVADVTGDQAVPKVRLRANPPALPGVDPTDEREPTGEPVLAEEATTSVEPISAPSDPPGPALDPTTEPTPDPTTEPDPQPTPEPTPLLLTPGPTPVPTPENRVPVADAGGPYKVDEGDTIKLDGRGSSDPDGDIVAYEWTRKKRLDDPTKKRPVFSALDDDVVEIELTVTDDDGATDTASAKIKVRNVDPRLAGFGPFEVTVGEELVIDAIVFRDPGAKDTHEVTVDWGDGTASIAAISEGGTSAGASHTYSAAGQYAMKISVTDDDGGDGSRKTEVSVTGLPAQEPAAAKVEGVAD